MSPTGDEAILLIVLALLLLAFGVVLVPDECFTPAQEMTVKTKEMGA